MVKLQMDMLASQNNVDAIWEALRNPPQGFSAIYDDVMDRIRRQTELDKNLAENAIYWVAYACRPLSMTEFRYALAISKQGEGTEPSALPDMDIVLSVCAGILTVDEDEKSVRLIRQ
jgi:hypothetical protein